MLLRLKGSRPAQYQHDAEARFSHHDGRRVLVMEGESCVSAPVIEWEVWVRSDTSRKSRWIDLWRAIESHAVVYDYVDERLVAPRDRTERARGYVVE